MMGTAAAKHRSTSSSLHPQGTAIMLIRSTLTASDQPTPTETAENPSCNMLENQQPSLPPMGPDNPDNLLLKPIRRAIRAKTAIAIIGCSRSHFFALQNAKDPAFDSTFARSFKLGNSSHSPTVWYADEIEAWLEARAAVSRKQH
jgi:predicted DNA-binding transcriptional regulator AlpA